VDVDNKCIRLTVPIALDIVDKNWDPREIPGDPNPSPYSHTSLIFEVVCKPGFLTEDSRILQFQFESASFKKGYESVTTIGFDSMPKIEEEWPALRDVPDVRAFMRKMASEMMEVDERGKKNEFKNSLFYMVAALPLPDYADNVEGYTLNVHPFAYEDVIIEKKHVGYLFAVFSVESLNLPPDCNCIEDRSEDTQKYMPIVKTWDPPDYFALALSQEGLQEIFKDYAHGGDAFNTQRNFMKILHGRIRSAYRWEAKLPVIQEQKIWEKADGLWEGTVTGCMTDPIFENEIASASASLSLELKDVEVTLRIVLKSNRDMQSNYQIIFDPEVHIGDIKVDIDLPGRFVKVEEWISNTVLDLFKKSFAREATRLLRRKFLHESGGRGNFVQGIVIREPVLTYPSESIIILAETWIDRTGLEA
jgi:hypothetical protein